MYLCNLMSRSCRGGNGCFYVRACVRACMRACARVCEWVSERARACVSACVSVCVCVCVCACVCACVRARVRACVRVMWCKSSGVHDNLQCSEVRSHVSWRGVGEDAYFGSLWRRLNVQLQALWWHTSESVGQWYPLELRKSVMTLKTPGVFKT